MLRRVFFGILRATAHSAVVVLGTLRCATAALGAPPEAADFEQALCTGLATEVAAAGDRQHIERHDILVALNVNGDEPLRQPALSHCLADALRDDGFTIDASGTARGAHDLLTITVGLPQALSGVDDDERVDFTVSRCRPGGRFWAHPGYVDFHRRNGLWSNDATTITRFVDGACSVRPPLKQ